VEQAILARHGESVYSARALMNGDPSVPVGLTAAGVAQARALGEQLRGTPVDLAVTSALGRTIATADEALLGRTVPTLRLADLNDPDYGVFEGRPLDEYRAWAAANSSSASPPGCGESRQGLVTRYVRAFRTLRERPEGTILVVAHSLPIAYALAGREGGAPRPQMPLIDYATPHRFAADELAAAADTLERWLDEPGF
jgi:probable phosphoglycerate mutase